MIAAIFDGHGKSGWIIFSLVGLIFLLVLGGKAELEEHQTFCNNGLLYSKFDKKPFTGIVIGSGYDGYRIHKCTFEKEYKDGKLNGISYYWYLSGALESIEPYEDGLLDGTVIRYAPNGLQKMKIYMVKGMRYGNPVDLSRNTPRKS